MRIIFMGTPFFAVPALEAIKNSEHEICFVVSQPDSPKDRGKKIKAAPVKEKALEMGLTVLQPENIKTDRIFFDKLEKSCPDLVVVAAYGKILPKEILLMPKSGCVNIHASLLPRFRGAAPIQRAILAGDRCTGVTIMCMEEGLDTGDILSSAETEIDRKTSGQLHDELAVLGAELLMKTIKSIEKGEIVRKPQNESLSTYAPMINKKEGEIDFSKKPSEIERLIRAFDPRPGAYTFYKGEMLKIWKAEAFEQEDCGGKKPGTVISISENGIGIVAGKGLLLVRELQMPGRKKMAVKDFLRGNSIEIMTVLG